MTVGAELDSVKVGDRVSPALGMSESGSRVQLGAPAAPNGGRSWMRQLAVFFGLFGTAALLFIIWSQTFNGWLLLAWFVVGYAALVALMVLVAQWFTSRTGPGGAS